MKRLVREEEERRGKYEKRMQDMTREREERLTTRVIMVGMDQKQNYSSQGPTRATRYE